MAPERRDKLLALVAFRWPFSCSCVFEHFAPFTLISRVSSIPVATNLLPFLFSPSCGLQRCFKSVIWQAVSLKPSVVPRSCKGASQLKRWFDGAASYVPQVIACKFFRAATLTFTTRGPFNDIFAGFWQSIYHSRRQNGGQVIITKAPTSKSFV